MINIQRIVCPTDLSAESDETLRYAVALTRAYDAELLLLHCTTLKSRPPEPQSPHVTIDMACRFQQALVNHLGLAELSKLKWHAPAIDNLQDVGKRIAQPDGGSTRQSQRVCPHQTIPTGLLRNDGRLDHSPDSPACTSRG
jgi:hypothetical protein